MLRMSPSGRIRFLRPDHALTGAGNEAGGTRTGFLSPRRRTQAGHSMSCTRRLLRHLRVGLTLFIVLQVPMLPVRAENASPEHEATSQPASIQDDPRVKRWWPAMIWGTMIVLALVVASCAIVIFSRRYLAYLTRGRTESTSSEDVWSMHKLPDEFEQNPRHDPDHPENNDA